MRLSINLKGGMKMDDLINLVGLGRSSGCARGNLRWLLPISRWALTLASIVMMSEAAQSQWVYDGTFPPSNALIGTNGVHGLTVDPQGRVWIQTFSGPHAVYCFNSNGTQASFSPITTISADGLSCKFDTTDARGLATNTIGNILVSTRKHLFLVNFLTGIGIHIATPFAYQGSISGPACDSSGGVYLANVGSGFPLKQYDQNLSSPLVIGDTVSAVGRTLAVSPNGLDLWLPRFANGSPSILRFHRTSRVGSFSFVDSIGAGLAGESMAWQPHKARLWVSSGSYFDLPDTSRYRANTWYAIDTSTNKIVDSILWRYNYAKNPYERPRAIAFSPSGDTAYVGCIGGGWDSSPYYPPVQRFKRVVTAISPTEAPRVLLLMQNYPNPFNPSTTIRYGLPSRAHVTLTVFNTLGQRVAILQNGEQDAGYHEVHFDGSNLPSGVYFYRMQAGSYTETKKLLLVR
jgi:hypothetical protein